MPRLLDKLLSHPKITSNDPAPREDLQALARQLDSPVPLTLAALWRTSDGLNFNSRNAELLGPAKILELMQIEVLQELCFDRGWLPFFDNHQSNYLVLALREPLAPRVLFFPHDDTPRLLYRDIESCLRGLLTTAENPGATGFEFHESTTDYAPDTERTESDQEAAEALLAAPHKNDEWNLAIQLLNDTNLEPWKIVLETDHFIRRDALARMKQMSAPAIRQLLQHDHQEFEAFMQRATAALNAAGIKITERQDTSLYSDGKWYPMESFFHKRNKPEALPKMIAWIQDLRANRNPHHRPNNFNSIE